MVRLKPDARAIATRSSWQESTARSQWSLPDDLSRLALKGIQVHSTDTRADHPFRSRRRDRADAQRPATKGPRSLTRDRAAVRLIGLVTVTKSEPPSPMPTQLPASRRPGPSCSLGSVQAGHKSGERCPAGSEGRIDGHAVSSNWRRGSARHERMVPPDHSLRGGPSSRRQRQPELCQMREFRSAAPARAKCRIVSRAPRA
jgi:hypothetical protein